MATADLEQRPAAAPPKLPPLEPGDHLDQPTFHDRYLAMPEDVSAELIGGVVYMTAAAKRKHGQYHALMMGWLHDYCTATPGTDVFDGATVILADDSEPQPDGGLIVIGGQTRENEDGFLVGPPEFVGEIASSSESYDLHSKKRDYERWGVQEYVVFVVRTERVVWFVREGDRFAEMPADAHGVLRSKQFPGLWLDEGAFFVVDRKRLKEVLEQVLASPEHAAFVNTLPGPQ